MSKALACFEKNTRDWFSQKIGKPTPVQEEGWPAISSGENVLISAPTGTGKTLASFLVFIDKLKKLASENALESKVYVIYISPLKALGNDIRENLRKPLDGIPASGQEITAAVRTGDTPPSERQRMIRKPPHILITTPESLFLLLTSLSGRNMLAGAQAIIIDELHALINTKRGAHLMFSLARLDDLCGRKLQKIGLSATIEPLSLSADYLAAGDPVRIIAPKMQKKAEIWVTSPLEDMRVLPNGTIWPEIARAVYEKCREVRTVIVFLEGRAQSENLAFQINEIAGAGFARTHHGCVSKEQRLEAEQQLRSGELRVLCATSSMELGIDVGEVDMVLQVGFPAAISSAMQRLGRAGHNPGRTSVMHMFPRTAVEGIYCAMTASVAMRGGIEQSRPPRKCLDVLAQHIVSMVAAEPASEADIFALAQSAYNFKDVTLEDIRAILKMLAGDFEHSLDHPAKPRVLYDRIHGIVMGDQYSRMLALSAGGTIPDRGWYAARLADGTKLGELDEEYVFEARVGHKFLLGAFAWKITEIRKDSVIVVPTTPEGAHTPFWKGDGYGRSYKTGVAFGKYLREIMEAGNSGSMYDTFKSMRMDDAAANNSFRFINRQIEITGCLPDDRTIVIEHFADNTGSCQMMVHSVFGKRVNAGLSLLLQDVARRATGMDISCFEDDDGILLYPYGGERELPSGLLQRIHPENARALLMAILPASPLFNMAFRYNAGRALLMGTRNGQRQPLWVQRLRGAQVLDSAVLQEGHPLIDETKRECLEDYWDLDAIEEVLSDIQSGRIQIMEVRLSEPSPMSLPLRRQAEMEFTYDYNPTTTNMRRATGQALEAVEMIAPGQEQLERVSERSRQPKDMMQLHSLMMAEGDVIAGEIEASAQWFDSLARQERLLYIEPGLWICAEQREQYEAAFGGDIGEQLNIIRRCMRYRGPQDAQLLSSRYFWSEEHCEGLLSQLCGQDAVVHNAADGLYYHAQLYSRAQKETVFMRRKQIETLPPERYAALMASRLRTSGTSAEQLKQAMEQLLDIPLAAAWWEGFVLPARVSGYRPALLDELLSQGEIFWRINGNGGEKQTLSFHRYEEIDWEQDVFAKSADLSGDDEAIARALLQRGASFAQGLTPVIGGRPPLDALLSLAENGLARADSFQPVRQWLAREKLQNHSPRSRARARVAASMSGRWELDRPLLSRTAEDDIEKAFDRSRLLCKETLSGSASGISWTQALEVLRIWEYTGKTRRGYFLGGRGMSGAQFIRASDFDAVTAAMNQPSGDIIWMCAADPFQPWGRALAHLDGREFMCVPSTIVALKSGLPVAVIERQGAVFRTLGAVCDDVLSEALEAFVLAFEQKRVFPASDNVTVKTYPEDAAAMLAGAGFSRQMLDYVLWRKRIY